MPFYYLENRNKTISQIKEESIANDKAVAEKEKAIDAHNRRNMSFRRVSGYNARNAVNYAHRWARGFNPAYRCFDPRVAGEGPANGGDCTNFVSQCLKAGGMRETKPKVVQSRLLSSTNFWFGNIFNTSTAFMRVTDFHSYWAPRVRDANYEGDTTVSRNGNLGDVVQFRMADTGRRWHSMIITKKDSKQVYLSGHSIPRYDYGISNYNDYKYNCSLLDF